MWFVVRRPACGLLRVAWRVVCSVGYKLGKHACKIKSGLSVWLKGLGVVCVCGVR